MVYVRHFWETEHLNPKSGCSWSEVRFRVKTKVFCDGIVSKVVNQLGKSSDKPNGGKGRQEQVPYRHGTTAIPSRLVFKAIPSIDNADSIERNGNNGQPRIVDHPITKRDGIIVQFKAIKNKKKAFRWVRPSRAILQQTISQTLLTLCTPCQKCWDIDKPGFQTKLQPNLSWHKPRLSETKSWSIDIHSFTRWDETPATPVIDNSNRRWCLLWEWDIAYLTRMRCIGFVVVQLLRGGSWLSDGRPTSANGNSGRQQLHTLFLVTNPVNRIGTGFLKNPNDSEWRRTCNIHVSSYRVKCDRLIWARWGVSVRDPSLLAGSH